MNSLLPRYPVEGEQEMSKVIPDKQVETKHAMPCENALALRYALNLFLKNFHLRHKLITCRKCRGSLRAETHT